MVRGIQPGKRPSAEEKPAAILAVTAQLCDIQGKKQRLGEDRRVYAIGNSRKALCAVVHMVGIVYVHILIM